MNIFYQFGPEAYLAPGVVEARFKVEDIFDEPKTNAGAADCRQRSFTTLQAPCHPLPGGLQRVVGAVCDAQGYRGYRSRTLMVSCEPSKRDMPVPCGVQVFAIFGVFAYGTQSERKYPLKEVASHRS